jgi:hypothetical protein
LPYVSQKDPSCTFALGGRILLFFGFLPAFLFAQVPDTTYAERLGFPAGARVVILHVDDAGMSF